MAERYCISTGESEMWLNKPLSEFGKLSLENQDRFARQAMAYVHCI
jgi:hypothetical protein